MKYAAVRLTGQALGLDIGTLDAIRSVLGPGTVIVDGWVYEIDEEALGSVVQIQGIENGIMTALIGPI